MNLSTHTFVDWRPITSLPIVDKLLQDSEWIVCTQEEVDAFLEDCAPVDAEKIHIEYRYICRNDGFIIFQVKSPDSEEKRALVALAKKISSIIKEKSGHTHIYNASTGEYSDAKLSTNPVLCVEDRVINAADHSSFVQLAKDSDSIKSLKAYSINGKRSTDEEAVLTVKKLYSSMFDRVCHRIDKTDQEVKISGIGISSQWLTLPFISFALVILFGLSAVIYHYFNTNLKVVIGIIYILFVGVVAFEIHKNLKAKYFDRIKLIRIVYGHYGHANNMSRALWKLFSVENYPPNNDYDPTIQVLENMINARIQVVNYIYFRSSSFLGLLGIIISIFIVK